MRLALILDPTDVRRWHCRLIEALRRDGHGVGILDHSRHPKEAKTARRLDGVCAAERKLGLVPADHPIALATATDVAKLRAATTPDGVDCTIDLVNAGASGLCIAPLFDGSPSAAA